MFCLVLNCCIIICMFCFNKDSAEPMQVDAYYEENDNVHTAPGGTVENTTLVYAYIIYSVLLCI